MKKMIAAILLFLSVPSFAQFNSGGSPFSGIKPEQISDGTFSGKTYIFPAGSTVSVNGSFAISGSTVDLTTIDSDVSILNSEVNLLNLSTAALQVGVDGKSSLSANNTFTGINTFVGPPVKVSSASFADQVAGDDSEIMASAGGTRNDISFAIGGDFSKRRTGIQLWQKGLLTDDADANGYRTGVNIFGFDPFAVGQGTGTALGVLRLDDRTTTRRLVLATQSLRPDACYPIRLQPQFGANGVDLNLDDCSGDVTVQAKEGSSVFMTLSNSAAQVALSTNSFNVTDIDNIYLNPAGVADPLDSAWAIDRGGFVLHKGSYQVTGTLESLGVVTMSTQVFTGPLSVSGLFEVVNATAEITQSGFGDAVSHIRLLNNDIADQKQKRVDISLSNETPPYLGFGFTDNLGNRDTSVKIAPAAGGGPALFILDVSSVSMTSGGMTIPESLLVVSSVTAGSFQGAFESQPLASFINTVPDRLGVFKYCLDCSAAAVCVSTGTTNAGDWSDISSRTTDCL